MVALLEPFIDTIVICSMTGLVIITTGVWNAPHSDGDHPWSGEAATLGYVTVDATGNNEATDAPAQIRFENGAPADPGGVHIAWHDAFVDMLYVDEAQTTPFTRHRCPFRRPCQGR